MKLISNTSFGELCKSKEKEFPTRNVYLAWYEEIRTNYDNFLKQSLNLGMFVPCDNDGNILEPPIYTTNHSDECYCKECEEETKRCSDLQDQYQKAKEKVLFVFKPHFDISVIKHHILQYRNIEYLANFGELELTENAIKQIGI